MHASMKALHGKAIKADEDKQPASFKPFKASEHPDRDYRGEKVVNGVKMRT